MSVLTEEEIANWQVADALHEAGLALDEAERRLAEALGRAVVGGLDVSRAIEHALRVTCNVSELVVGVNQPEAEAES